MCNANNHPPGCTCGFGGEGHLGGNSSRSGYPTYVPPPQFDAYETFVNPNARCPICTLPVFFYQSEYGGRVFFDELGPPWPKHPCTDNGREPLELDSYSGSIDLPFHWQKDDWKPILRCKIDSVDPFVWRISGLIGGVETGLFLDRDLAGNHIFAGLKLLMAQCRAVASGEYRVSLYTAVYDLIELTAYAKRYDARNRTVDTQYQSDPHGIRASNERHKEFKLFLDGHLNDLYKRPDLNGHKGLKKLEQSILDKRKYIGDRALLERAKVAELRLHRFQEAMKKDRLEELAAEIYTKCDPLPNTHSEREMLGQDLSLLIACLPKDERRNKARFYLNDIRYNKALGNRTPPSG
jgi:hypothetical protein